MDQEIGVLEDGFHLLRVGDEVRRQVAAVELHALDRLQRGLETLGLFHGDDAVLANLFHRIGDQLADFRIVVRGDGADLGNLLLARGRGGDLLQLFDNGLNRAVDALLELHRVRAGRHVLEAFAVDRLGQHGRRGGAVAGEVAGLGRDFLDHLRAHVLDRIGQLDLLGNRHAVLGDRRGAELLVDDHIPALGAEGDLHRVGEGIDAPLELGTGVTVEHQVFSSHCRNLLSGSRTSSADLGEDVRSLDDDDFVAIDGVRRAAVLAVDDHVAYRDVHLDPLALLNTARADGDYFALGRLLFGGVGDVQPAAHGLGLVGRLDHDPVLEGVELDLGLGLRGTHGNILHVGDVCKPKNNNDLAVSHCQQLG